MSDLSKWLSYILRHEPQSIGLKLDPSGWAQIVDLIEKSRTAGRQFTREDLIKTIETSDKQRFTLSPDRLRLRAAQGHSFAVDLQLAESTPPYHLWHGAAAGAIAAIRRDGLLPMGRAQVHLSKDVETARRVGMRHGEAIVLRVDTQTMVKDGHQFFQADNGVWLTGPVPPSYLSERAIPCGLSDYSARAPTPLEKEFEACLSQGLNDAVYGRLSDGHETSARHHSCFGSSIVSAVNSAKRTRRVFVAHDAVDALDELIMDTAEDTDPRPLIKRLTAVVTAIADNPHDGSAVPGLVGGWRLGIAHRPSKYATTAAAFVYCFTDDRVFIVSYIDEHYRTEVQGVFSELGLV